MAHEEQRDVVRGRPAGQGQATFGRGGRLNEKIERSIILEELRDLDYPVTRRDLADETRRRHLPPQLSDTIDRMPEREYVSPEDVADEAEQPHEGGANEAGTRPEGRHCE